MTVHACVNVCSHMSEYICMWRSAVDIVILSHSSLYLPRQGLSLNPEGASLPRESKDLGLPIGHHTHSAFFFSFFFNVGIPVITPSWQILYPVTHLLSLFSYVRSYYMTCTHTNYMHISVRHIPLNSMLYKCHIGLAIQTTECFIMKC